LAHYIVFFAAIHFSKNLITVDHYIPLIFRDVGMLAATESPCGMPFGFQPCRIVLLAFCLLNFLYFRFNAVVAYSIQIYFSCFQYFSDSVLKLKVAASVASAVTTGDRKPGE
jgi:hypothetical protein